MADHHLEVKPRHQLLAAVVEAASRDQSKKENALTRVLFVCTGNTCRSPMAAALYRSLTGDLADSAGSNAAPDLPANPEAIKEMRKRGIDLSAHRSKEVSAVDLRDFDAIVCMTPENARAVEHHADLNPGWFSRVLIALHLRRAPRLIVWKVPDPIGQGAAAYRNTADVLTRQIESL